MFEFSGDFEFDWDAANRDKILAKHGFLPEQVEAFFRAKPAFGPDTKHSRHEIRYLAVGTGEDGAWMLASFTVRRRHGLTLIRPISVRRMHAKEVKAYEAKKEDHGG